jgi:hypothetical protein
MVEQEAVFAVRRIRGYWFGVAIEAKKCSLDSETFFRE